MANSPPAPGEAEISAAPGKGKARDQAYFILFIECNFLFSTIFSERYCYKLRQFQHNQQIGERMGGEGERGAKKKKKNFARVEIFYRHLTGYVQDRDTLRDLPEHPGLGSSPGASLRLCCCCCNAGLDAPARKKGDENRVRTGTSRAQRVPRPPPPRRNPKGFLQHTQPLKKKKKNRKRKQGLINMLSEK